MKRWKLIYLNARNERIEETVGAHSYDAVWRGALARYGDITVLDVLQIEEGK